MLVVLTYDSPVPFIHSVKSDTRGKSSYLLYFAYSATIPSKTSNRFNYNSTASLVPRIP